MSGASRSEIGMKRLLIANRGEIACRILRTCKRLGLETVAIYSEADADALHVSLADSAVPVGGAAPAQSYLSIENILQAARSSGADALHPGYGFLSENENFAGAVEAAGLRWIGPDPKTIGDMGDKERARQRAKAAGVPTLPGSPRFSPGSAGIEDAAREVGFPLIVKAAAGGGGIGIRRVNRLEDLAEAVDSTQQMAQRAFGDGTVYLERYIAEARHIEVQVFGYGDGRAVHLHERDCSIQRRFQKIIEESPAPQLPLTTREAMFAAAIALCRQERYRGAGTIEFVFDRQTQQFYFLEMNTRIQVEHPVTEMVTGLDLVEMQLTLNPVSQTVIKSSGHAIECRLYAERPAKNFLPSPGLLESFELPPTGPEVRVDTGVRAGDRITHFYDPMIAKVIVRGGDRYEAIERMVSTLCSIRLGGIETNLDFLKRVVQHPAFREGAVFTGFVDRFKSELLT
jgi:3-methylcrotonyl-CoA carboxylase alpha subunit